MAFMHIPVNVTKKGLKFNRANNLLEGSKRETDKQIFQSSMICYAPACALAIIIINTNGQSLKPIIL